MEPRYFSRKVLLSILSSRETVVGGVADFMVRKSIVSSMISFRIADEVDIVVRGPPYVARLLNETALYLTAFICILNRYRWMLKLGK